MSRRIQQMQDFSSAGNCNVCKAGANPASWSKDWRLHHARSAHAPQQLFACPVVCSNTSSPSFQLRLLCVAATVTVWADLPITSHSRFSAVGHSFLRSFPPTECRGLCGTHSGLFSQHSPERPTPAAACLSASLHHRLPTPQPTYPLCWAVPLVGVLKCSSAAASAPVPQRLH